MITTTKVVLLLVLFEACFGIEYYKTHNKKVDMDALVKDKDRFNVVTECLLDIGPCDEVIQSYKDITQSAVEGACDRCNSELKHLAVGYMQGLEKNNPKYYAEYLKKYDPNGIYMDKFKAAIAGF
ncbi:allergen Tha p 1-like [Leptidea sinapis]|uniref:allergen Tha p 1-like n=1 Tax=Leptidea sinapis TaxID=189913 RepID=UPI0021355CEC|nr:allergen Tha p 1-like [Leptidea sinapis]